MFQKTDLARKCAIITSYEPKPGDIRGEESGEGLTEKLLKYNIYRQMLAAHFNVDEDKAMGKSTEFEQQVKHCFINEPGQMKLLIVVDKLLTGFDAPSATYLYIDKTMRDHGLFQAICRVNRLDGEDKEYGYIIDYKDLFMSLEKSIEDYTGHAFDGYERDDIIGMLKSRIDKGKERLDNLLEKVRALCEPVRTPKTTCEYIHYFCTDDSGNIQQLKENENKRVVFYKHVAALIRAYADLANEMDKAGYSQSETERIQSEIRHYEKVRKEIQLSSGDYVDKKKYEPAMRNLLDMYIRAEESKTITAFDDMSLIQLIVDKGEEAIDTLPEGIRNNNKAVAETIENNVRKLIIDESPVNPKYYENMSDLLDTLIRQRKVGALAYKDYLKRIIELTKKVSGQEFQTSYPTSIKTSGQRALYDNLDQDEHLALKVDKAIHKVKKDDWRKTRIKKREVRNAINKALEGDTDLTNIIFSIVEEPKSGY
jgi:type I restriction enzyme R subunit